MGKWVGEKDSRPPYYHHHHFFTMSTEFPQLEFDAEAEDDLRQLVRLAVREDLDRGLDWTTVSLVPEEASASAAVVARGPGVVAGVRACEVVLDEMQADVEWKPHVGDGARLSAGQTIAIAQGSARDLLTSERLLLNLLGRLSGVATLTRRYVDAIEGTAARIYDTRKTTPGLRRLEKLAVRSGGGCNHRLGLNSAVLIKDNHLAFGNAEGSGRFTIAQAVERTRSLLREMADRGAPAEPIIECEVDSLEQLAEVLPAAPDIVLLDNMPPETLRRAVALRDKSAPGLQLEASGGVNLDSVRDIAETGVERISVGALTHSAASLDVGLDWR